MVSEIHTGYQVTSGMKECHGNGSGGKKLFDYDQDVGGGENNSGRTAALPGQAQWAHCRFGGFSCYSLSGSVFSLATARAEIIF